LPESKVRKTNTGKASAQKRFTPSSKTRGAEVKHAVSQRLAADDGPRQRRWLLPAAIVLAALGVAWILVHFLKPHLVGPAADLGQLNILIGAVAVVIAVFGYLALRPRTGTPYAPGSRRWVAPTFITVGLLGVVWLIVYYVAGQDVWFMALLGNWNILIGMAGMAGAFVISTMWK
jgi:ferric-dicitrate binding protein FerR (iron transport regulator)